MSYRITNLTEEPKRFSYERTWLRALLSVGALSLVAYQLSHHRIQGMLSPDWFGILLASGLMGISKWFSAKRYCIILGRGGVKLNHNLLIRLYWQGMFYNQFLPGGIGGDGYKVWRLRQKTTLTIQHLAWLTLLDRLLGLVPIVLLLVLALIYQYQLYSWSVGLVLSS